MTERWCRQTKKDGSQHFAAALPGSDYCGIHGGFIPTMVASPRDTYTLQWAVEFRSVVGGPFETVDYRPKESERDVRERAARINSAECNFARVISRRVSKWTPEVTERKWKIKKISSGLMQGWWLVPPWNSSGFIFETFEEAVNAISPDYQSVLTDDD